MYTTISRALGWLAAGAVLTVLLVGCSDDSSGSNGLEEGQCREDADCDESGAYCGPASGSSDLAPVCGTCQGDTCNMDPDCGPGTICETETPASCPNCPAVKTCVAVCTDTSCPAGTTCNAMTGRCEATVCSDDDGCPLPFECSGGRCQEIDCASNDDCRGELVCASAGCVEAQCAANEDCNPQFDCDNGLCLRRACESDEVCDNEGYCVGQLCYNTPGSCQLPAP